MSGSLNLYLLDTNIVLELLLEREGASDVENFLTKTPRQEIFISEFTLYSLGVFLTRRKKGDTFLQFVDDMLLRGGIRPVRIEPKDMPATVDAMSRFHLDFDDLPMPRFSG